MWLRNCRITSCKHWEKLNFKMSFHSHCCFSWACRWIGGSRQTSLGIPRHRTYKQPNRDTANLSWAKLLRKLALEPIEERQFWHKQTCILLFWKDINLQYLIDNTTREISFTRILSFSILSLSLYFLPPLWWKKKRTKQNKKTTIIPWNIKTL